MLNHFEMAKKRVLEQAVTRAKEGPHKEAVAKVVALFTYTYNNTELTQSSRPKRLLFTDLVHKLEWDAKHHFLEIGFDNTKNQYLVLRSSRLQMSGQDSYFEENTLTQEQILSLAKAYDLGLHLGTFVRFEERKGKYYLSFGPNNYAPAFEALSAWDNASFRPSNIPNYIELFEPLQDLVNQCYGGIVIEKREKLTPQ